MFLRIKVSDIDHIVVFYLVEGEKKLQKVLILRKFAIVLQPDLAAK